MTTKTLRWGKMLSRVLVSGQLKTLAVGICCLWLGSQSVQAQTVRTATTSHSATTRTATINRSNTNAAAAAAAKKQFRINLAWQIALDAAGFSPGIIDGSFGAKGHLALDEYAERFFPGTNSLDLKVFEALKVDVDNVLAKYTIAQADADEVGDLPNDWNEKAKLTKLPYESLLDCLAEKFHCTKALLGRINPGVNLNKLTVGQEITVPNLRPFPASGGLEVPPFPLIDDATDSDDTTSTSTSTRHRKKSGPTPAYIQVNLSQKCIRVFDKEDQEIALFHCSVAKDKAKLPGRDTVIKTMAQPPMYTFNPSMWPDVTNVDHILNIPQGPRNPVGLAWMGLDLPGYGMHGNPHPELIGKTGSHGCFRLTNWDALRLYSMAHVGMPVKIVSPPPPDRSNRD